MSSLPYVLSARSTARAQSGSLLTSSSREQRLAAGRGDLARDLLAELGADVAEHDARALLREQPRLGLALAARGARDQRDLAGEPAHQPLPSSGSAAS